MTRWLIRWALNIVVIMIAAQTLPWLKVDGWTAAIIASIVLGLLNAIVRPIIKLITLPITILTLGLFTLVINGLMVLLTSALVEGFKVGGFIDAILVSIVLSIGGVIISWLVGDGDDD